MNWIAVFISWAVGFLFGSFVEYWGHRLMHARLLLWEDHLNHHATGRGKGVVPEFLHYMRYTFILMPWGFLISIEAGLGYLTGCIAYAFFSAYGHQLQHDSPYACFWMRKVPVHYLHHKYDQDKANLGLAVDWWDRVFRTYVPMEVDSEELKRKSRGGLLAVDWL